MFLKIPNYKIITFGMLQFAEHVLDTSPFVTRSQERPILNAVNAIASAEDGIAEMADIDAKAFQAACDAVEYPKLTMTHLDDAGKPVGEPIAVPRSAFRQFYEAVESMTAERPEPTAPAVAADSPA